MTSADTNLLVRLLTGDDRDQARRAAKLFSETEVFIPKTVVLETEWVLRYAYGFESEAIVVGLQRLFGLENVTVEDSPAIAQALSWHTEGLDFADALHLASSQHVDQFATFDRALEKRARQIGAKRVVAI